MLLNQKNYDAASLRHSVSMQLRGLWSASSVCRCVLTEIVRRQSTREQFQSSIFSVAAQSTNRPRVNHEAETGARIREPENHRFPGDLLDRISAPHGSDLPLPRALLIFAHPDDEVIAAGARLERFQESRLICVTDGAPQDGLDAQAKGFSSIAEYSKARYAELENALCHAQLDPKRFLTKLNPGPSARPIADQEATWRLTELTQALAAELRGFQPEAVLTHPYEGGHPDHDACAFAVYAATRLACAACAIIEAPFYHAGQNGIATGQFLPNGPAALIRRLSLVERRNKKERIGCFVTQAETLRPFTIEEEQYRFAPDYDFTQPPHPGKLFYENFPWGINAAQFRELAAATLRALQINGGDPWESKSNA